MSGDPLHIEVFVDDAFGENAFVLSTRDADGRQVGWIVDPSFPPQVNELLNFVQRRTMTIEKVILTHAHADHIAGLDEVHEAHPNAPVYLAEIEHPMLTDGTLNLSAPFGMSLTCATRADHDLHEGIELSLGGTKWRVFDTSGHSPGGRSLYCASERVVIAGDAIFTGSIGRTDFPNSNHESLILNIREKLLTLPDDTRVFSGHGPVTTIGNERKSNPFLSDL